VIYPLQYRHRLWGPTLSLAFISLSSPSFSPPTDASLGPITSSSRRLSVCSPAALTALPIAAEDWRLVVVWFVAAASLATTTQALSGSIPWQLDGRAMFPSGVSI